ncbi:hypothetical protein DNTS_006741, partial [Danionella cerebrum]
NMDDSPHRKSRRLQGKLNQGKKAVFYQKLQAMPSEEKNSTTRVKRRLSIIPSKSARSHLWHTGLLKDFFSSVKQGYQSGLSDYQLERLKNIQQNKAFLSSLKLTEFAESLRPKSRPQKRTKTRVLPVRKSLRLQKMDPLTPVSFETTLTTIKVGVANNVKPSGPIPLDPINLGEQNKLPEDLVHTWKDVSFNKSNNISSISHMYQRMLQKLSINDNLVMKVGANWGDAGVICFAPHSHAINSMAFSPHQCNLITVSNDGFARSMDLEKAVFDEVSSWAGDVAVVDRRAGKSCETVHCMMTHPIRSVHVHPEQKHYFVVAEGSFVNIYDLRNLKRTKCQSISELHGHALSVSSAFFSPLTGNRVVTTCRDNRIRIFDTSKMDGLSPMLNSVERNIQKGWRLSAVWDPKHQECFVFGNPGKTPRIEVYHESGRILHSLQNKEHLTTVCSIAAFHPSRNILLGGNSSGKLHIFTD